MKKFGLIGHPIEHSTSPAVFSAGYKGRPYTYDLIEGEDFEESYRRFIESYDGINVTAPFKELAFARADLHSPECEVIGATNLLVKTPEGVKAYNSDYYGIIFSILLGFGVNVENFPATPSAEFCRAALGKTGSPASKVKVDGIKKALVIGCGGAGKAAVVAAVNLGFETTLMNRTIDKASAFAERINQLTVRPPEDFAECFSQSDLIIYTLPCPIDGLGEIANQNVTSFGTTEKSTQSDNTPAGEKATPACSKKLIIEANYRDPAFTPELIAKISTREPGAKFIRGNVWHLYQAWSGYILLTGEAPDLAAMAEVDK